VKVEIFVVRSEKEDKWLLEMAKELLIEAFGGLTIIPNCKGFWLEDTQPNQTIKTKKPKICEDSVEIWLIYTDSPKHYAEYNAKRLSAMIKEATVQKSQLYVINDKPYFI